MIRQQKNGRLDTMAVGYVRRSTDRQEQSIPDQKKAISTYAQEHNLALVKFYVDDAISGTSTLGRRAFLQMITDAESCGQSFDKIVVYDVKRFGRVDNDEAGYYRHRLRSNGVEVIYVSENFNGDSTDDLLRPVKQWQARQESKDLSKVTIRGLLSKVEGGWWMGGTPPYGYDLRYQSADGQFLFALRYMQDRTKQVFDEKGKLTRTLGRSESVNTTKRDRAKLIPGDPDRVKVIEQIFKMYAEQGKGFKALAHTLNEKSVPTARGPEWSHIYSGKWTDTTIRSMLVNPIYTGDMVWNRRTDARFHQIKNGQAVERKNVHGARLVPNDESDWMIVRDAHPPLVSRRLFEQAKQRRECRIESIEQRGKNPRLQTQGRNWHGRRSRFILSGLLTCSLCGSRYQGLTRHKGKKRRDGSRVKNYYYGCGGHITKGKAVCEMNSIPQDVLESTVIDAVLDFYRPYLAKGGRLELGAEVKRLLGSEGKDLAGARERALAEKQKIDSTIGNLLDNITAVNRELVDKRLSELDKRRQQLEVRIEELERLSISQAEIQTVTSDAMHFIASLEHILRQGLPHEKLTALRQCIERAQVDKPACKVTLHVHPVPGQTGAAPVTLKRKLSLFGR